jgi:hypothetical protein
MSERRSTTGNDGGRTKREDRAIKIGGKKTDKAKTTFIIGGRKR